MHENAYYFYKNANVDSHHLEIVEISSTNSKSEAGFKNCPVLWQLPLIFGPVGTLNNNTQQVWFKSGFSTPVWKPESVFLTHCYPF